MQFHQHTSRGAAILIAVVFFVVISLVIVIGIGGAVTRDYATYRDLEKSKQAYLLAESGLEDAIYRIQNNKATSSPEVMSLNGGTITTTITPVSDTEQVVTATATFGTTTRVVSAKMTKATIATFAYGAEIGAGGLVMQNASRVNGTVYSAGAVSGGGSNVITGGVISAGPIGNGTGGSINGIANQGGNMMYAENITGSTISGTPYCSTISSSVMGTPAVTAACSPFYQLTGSGIPRVPPLSDAQIDEFKVEAQTGGIVTCSGGKYQINTSQSLGPKKIPCDLKVDGGGTLTLTGPVWVEGNIELKSTANINVSPLLGSTSVPMIADVVDTTQRKTKGTISVENNASFNVGAGQNADAQVILISWNTGASETPPNNTDAIKIQNNIDGNLMVYASHGNITMENDAVLSQVTAYKVKLKDNAIINYPTSLQNMNINSGTSSIKWSAFDWRTTQ